MRIITRSAIAISMLAAFNLATPLITNASAHAIIELNGVSAVAGTTSAMTLEIQHGCLPSGKTVKVEAFVGKPWRALTPKQVDGWSSTVEKQPKGGWHITWVKQGAGVDFAKPTFFPITVAWPKNPGAYGMSVWQTCSDGSSNYWNEKVTPATATADSPPLTPKPEVLVIAKSDAAKSTKSSSSRTATAHAH